MLPIGYICPDGEGMEGIEQTLLAKPPFAIRETKELLKNTLMVEFVHKAKTYPALISSTRISREWINSATTEHSTSPVWLTPGDCNLWIDAKRRLAYQKQQIASNVIKTAQALIIFFRVMTD
jgi:hypothetical protein